MPTPDNWRKAMTTPAALPQNGCFTVSYPGTTWKEVPCTAQTNAPHGPAVPGTGRQIRAGVSGTISVAEGSFPVVKGVTGVTNVLTKTDATAGQTTTTSTAGIFSLQMNSNHFNVPLCSGAADPSKCSGWQQFIYDSPGSVFTEYWLLDYNNKCPSTPAGQPTWNTSGTVNCVLNSKGMSVPAQPITNLGNMILTGQAGNGTDTAVLSTGTDIYVSSQPSTLNLGQSWDFAQFNVFGHNNGAEAVFNDGVSIVVQTMTDSASSTESAPACNQAGSVTAESNNLDDVPNSCCPVGGVSPLIQFEESNVSGAAAQTCPLPQPLVGVFSNGNFGYPANSPPALGDWAFGDYKGQCALGQPIVGVSRIPGELWSHAVECGASQSIYKSSGAGCYARQAETQDNRGDTDSGTDWDSGSYKTECAAGEYVAGVSQASGNGVLTSILCCPAKVTHSSCDTQVFYNSSSPADAPPDWDFGYYKGQCPSGQYVAGISSPAFTSVGLPGAAHAVLCCSP
jgi:hypothetical protein